MPIKGQNDSKVPYHSSIIADTSGCSQNIFCGLSLKPAHEDDYTIKFAGNILEETACPKLRPGFFGFLSPIVGNICNPVGLNEANRSILDWIRIGFERARGESKRAGRPE